MTMMDATVSVGAVLAEGLVLVSWWKPLLLLLPILPWAWLHAAILDKHCAQYHLPRQRWNMIHLTVGTLVFLGALLVPIKGEAAFWVAFGLLVLILAADVAVFVVVANRDERVPPQHRLTLDFSRWAEARKARAAAKLQGTVALTISAPDKTVLPPPTQTDSPEFQVRVAAEQVFIRGTEVRASQVDVAPTGKDNTYAVTFLVDGVRQPGSVMSAADAAKIIDVWKSGAKLDVSDRRRRMVGEVVVEHAGVKRKVRLATSGTQAGQRLTLTIDPEKQVRRKFEDLGLLEPQAAELKAIAADAKGVVLLGGVPHGGRTTTMYAVLKLHDAYTSNVQTVETEPQDSLEGARQNRFEPQAEGAEHSTLVRSILRRDPDIVAVADLPDAQTAKEIARAELERVRVYLSLRADSAIAAVQTWVKAVEDPVAAAKPLAGVLAQKLVRRLCPNCRVPYVPSAEILKKLGLPADKVKQLFKKGGQVLIKNKPEICPMCQGVGYQGQEGVFEVFKFGDEERKLVAAGNFQGLRLELRKRQLPTIQQAALRKAVEGITSIEEIMRVTMEPGAEGSAKPQAAPPAKPVATPAPAAKPTGAKPASA